MAFTRPFLHSLHPVPASLFLPRTRSFPNPNKFIAFSLSMEKLKIAEEMSGFALSTPLKRFLLLPGLIYQMLGRCLGGDRIWILYCIMDVAADLGNLVLGFYHRYVAETLLFFVTYLYGKWVDNLDVQFYRQDLCKTGGIDKEEDPRTAVMRELREETGVTPADIVAEVPYWLTYDIPPEVREKLKQQWVQSSDWKG